MICLFYLSQKAGFPSQISVFLGYDDMTVIITALLESGSRICSDKPESHCNFHVRRYLWVTKHINFRIGSVPLKTVHDYVIENQQNRLDIWTPWTAQSKPPISTHTRTQNLSDSGLQILLFQQPFEVGCLDESNRTIPTVLELTDGQEAVVWLTPSTSLRAPLHSMPFFRYQYGSKFHCLANLDQLHLSYLIFPYLRYPILIIWKLAHGLPAYEGFDHGLELHKFDLSRLVLGSAQALIGSQNNNPRVSHGEIFGIFDVGLSDNRVSHSNGCSSCFWFSDSHKIASEPLLDRPMSHCWLAIYRIICHHLLVSP